MSEMLRLNGTDGHSWLTHLQPLAMACCPQILLPSLEQRQGRPVLSPGVHIPVHGAPHVLQAWVPGGSGDLGAWLFLVFAFFTVCAVRWFSKNIGCRIWPNAAESVSHDSSCSLCARHRAKGLRRAQLSVTVVPCVEGHFRIEVSDVSAWVWTAQHHPEGLAALVAVWWG